MCKIFTKRELNKLRKKLPKGYRNTIRNKLGYAYSTIDTVLRGEYVNHKIINCAFDILKKHQKKINKKIEEQKKILNE